MDQGDSEGAIGRAVDGRRLVFSSFFFLPIMYVAGRVEIEVVHKNNLDDDAMVLFREGDFHFPRRVLPPPLPQPVGSGEANRSG